MSKSILRCAALTIILLGAYIAAFYALVTPTIDVLDVAVPAGKRAQGMVVVARYRFGEPVSEWLFAPMAALDRSLRPGAWNVANLLRP